MLLCIGRICLLLFAGQIRPVQKSEVWIWVIFFSCPCSPFIFTVRDTYCGTLSLLHPFLVRILLCKHICLCMIWLGCPFLCHLWGAYTLIYIVFHKSNFRSIWIFPGSPFFGIALLWHIGCIHRLPVICCATSQVRLPRQQEVWGWAGFSSFLSPF